MCESLFCFKFFLILFNLLFDSTIFEDIIDKLKKIIENICEINHDDYMDIDYEMIVL
jgi:hypothetical protein